MPPITSRWRSRPHRKLDQRHQDSWLEQLDQEDQNLRAALNFLLSNQDRERAVRFTGALGRYWYMRGRLSEGLNWTEQALGLRATSAARPEDRRALLLPACSPFTSIRTSGPAPGWKRVCNLCEDVADHVGFAWPPIC